MEINNIEHRIISIIYVKSGRGVNYELLADILKQEKEEIENVCKTLHEKGYIEIAEDSTEKDLLSLTEKGENTLTS